MQCMNATWVKKFVVATTENQSTEDTGTAQSGKCKCMLSKGTLRSFPLLTPRQQPGHWVFRHALLTGTSKSAPMPGTSSDPTLSRSGGCQEWERPSQPKQLGACPSRPRGMASPTGSCLLPPPLVPHSESKPEGIARTSQRTRGTCDTS